MTAPFTPVGGIPTPVASSPRRAPWMAHRTLKTVATIIVAVPAVLFGGLVALVEEPPVALWVLFMGLVLAAVLVLAWRWPVPGGVLVALVGLVPEWGWFTDQLEGNVQTLVESIGSVSPLWLAIPTVISGVLFVAAGLMPSGRRR